MLLPQRSALLPLAVTPTRRPKLQLPRHPYLPESLFLFVKRNMLRAIALIAVPRLTLAVMTWADRRCLPLSVLVGLSVEMQTTCYLLSLRRLDPILIELNLQLALHLHLL